VGAYLPGDPEPGIVPEPPADTTDPADQAVARGSTPSTCRISPGSSRGSAKRSRPMGPVFAPLVLARRTRLLALAGELAQPRASLADAAVHGRCRRRS